MPLLRYVFDRVQWAARLYGKYSPPMPSQYFDLSNAWHLWLFLLVSVAIAEEIIFRGLLLPRFVERYGLQQGILLIGLILGRDALCIRFDYGSSVTEVLYQLTNRIFSLRDLQLCFVVDDPSTRFNRFCGSCALGVEHAQYHPARRSSNIRRRTGNPFPLAGCDWIFTASILARHRKTACIKRNPRCRAGTRKLIHFCCSCVFIH
jgi:hypothetical protein